MQGVAIVGYADLYRSISLHPCSPPYTLDENVGTILDGTEEEFTMFTDMKCSACVDGDELKFSSIERVDGEVIGC